MSYQKTGCSGWYGSYRDHANRVRSVKGDSPEDVDLQLAQIAYNKKHNPNANLPTLVSHKTFQDILPAFYASRDLAESTLVDGACTLNKYILPILAAVPLKKIGQEHIQAVVDICRASKLKNNSINKHLSLIKSVCSFAYDSEVIDVPTRIKLLPDDKAVIAPPTKTEFDAILANAKPSTLRMAVLTALTGIRPGVQELFGLTWDDVDFEGRLIRVVSAKKGGLPLRLIPLNDQLLGILTAWKAEDGGRGHIVHYFGRQLTKSGWVGWHNTLKRAGITRRLRPYDLRHWFATWTLGSGADLRSVSDIMGHSKPTQTQNTYQHVIPSQRLAAVKLLPTIDYNTPAKPLNQSKLTTNNTR